MPSPTVIESLVRSAVSVVWLVMIALSILGVGGWVVNVPIAVIVSVVLRQVAIELRRHPYAPAELALERNT